MILYNITFSIDSIIQKKWLKWIQEKHIPDMMATGKFSGARMVKVLTEEAGSLTYSVQFLTDSKATLERYYTEDAPKLRQEGLALFSDKMLIFKTELEIISEH